jgi:hypothetical protein
MRSAAIGSSANNAHRTLGLRAGGDLLSPVATASGRFTASISAIDGGSRCSGRNSDVLAAMMQTLDTTIVNVALPYVQASVATRPDQIDWVLTAYILEQCTPCAETD